MTTAPTTPRPSTSGSGGMAPEEKKAATIGIGAAVLLGGPMGGIIAALAVGIEQAFSRSGWDRPDWTRIHASMTPEAVAERRRRYAEEAEAYLAEARGRRDARRKAAEEHHKNMKDYIENGREGDKPDRPDMRNPWEFLGDFLGASKSWYRLFDEKMASGNEKVNNFYGATGNFLRDFWNFFAGLVEGTREGWRQYQEDKRQREQEAAGESEQSDGEPDGENPDYHWGNPDDQLPTPDPAAELPEGDERPAVDPAPETSDPEPATGSGPVPETEPMPLDGGGSPLPLPDADPSTGPNGPAGNPALEGEVMTADGSPVPRSDADVPAHVGPQGTTNLDLLHAAFEPAQPVLRSIPPQVTALKMDATAVQNRLRYLAVLSNMTGVPLAAAQMIVEVHALINAVNAGLNGIDEHHATAMELTDEALIGLMPADQAQAETHAQQGSGDIYNRVGH
jgi:hypothetical protein